MRLQDYDLERPYQATVKSSTRITPEECDEVRELVLEVDHPDFHFEAGQSVGVLVPGRHALGHEVHFRLYSIANEPTPMPSGNPIITLCVKRVDYIDDYSGERFKGIASHYLCDRRAGDRITITGPYGLPFEVPDDREANLLMIGLGTGIAPFRAFVKHIYRNLGGWEGKVRLFYGAKTGLEMVYMNDERDDFANYYDRETFRAFKALSPRPHWDEPAALDQALTEHRREVWEMVSSPETWVYVAGLQSIREMLDKAFVQMAGSAEQWQRRKAELVAGGRWTELIY
ncbi:MAG: ferredoxin--NADP(+) reductase [Methylohalobius crimeensis]